MREIKLYSVDKKSFISLNDRRFLAGEITGLGNNFSITYHETSNGKTKKSVKPDFDTIAITIYFNIEGNPYHNYNYLMNFLMQNANRIFPLEYSDGTRKKFCDVILKSASKSQINEDGVFSEQFIFERQYYWYEEQEESFALKAIDSSKVSFPLPFPFGFTGISFINQYTITNNFFEEAPINIKIKGPIANNPINVKLTTEAGVVVKEIVLNAKCNEGDEISIDASIKKIVCLKNGVEQNGYGLTDKRKQSFMYLPLGTYTISSNLQITDEGAIEISVKRYLLD
jgi:hypothetical protein